jgi:hypothetical protein
MTFYATKYTYDNQDFREGRQNWTISTDPKETGWETDSGYSGYGLPKELAEMVAEAMNKVHPDCTWVRRNMEWLKK